MLILSSILSITSKHIPNLKTNAPFVTNYKYNENGYISLKKIAQSVGSFVHIVVKKPQSLKNQYRTNPSNVISVGGFKIKKKKLKPYKKRTAFKYLIRPLVFLTGQTILFSLSLKKRRISFSYHKFLKTNSIKHVSKIMYFCLVIKEPSFFLIPYSNMLTDLDMFSHRRLLRLAQSSLY